MPGRLWERAVLVTLTAETESADHRRRRGLFRVMLWAILQPMPGAGRLGARSHSRLRQQKHRPSVGYVAVAVRKQLRPEMEPASNPQALLGGPYICLSSPHAGRKVAKQWRQLGTNLTNRVCGRHFVSDTAAADPPQPHFPSPVRCRDCTALPSVPFQPLRGSPLTRTDGLSPSDNI